MNIFDTLIKNKQTDTQTHLFDVMSVGYIVLNNDNEVIQINHQALEELKMQEQDVWGKNISRLIAIRYDKLDILPESLQSLRCDVTDVEFSEHIHIKSNTTDAKFYIKGQLIGEYNRGKLIKSYLLFRNIEDELTQDSILNMALSRTKIFPWFYDIDRNQMVMDARWFAHFDLPVGDCSMSADEFAAMVHPNDREHLMTGIALQISGEIIADPYTFRLRRNDGSWEWMEGQSTHLGQVDGIPYRVIGVCQSIQEYKNTEATLIAARDKAQESDRLKSAFLANMSHEIRTPLNAIVGFSNLLTGGDVELDSEDAQEYFRLINDNSEQLLMLVSDILDLSKIESNTMEFTFISQPLNRLFRDIGKAQEMRMPEGVKLVLQLPLIETVVNTDPMRLLQVINNLINNAIKFTTQGSITVGYEREENGNYLRIFVRDTGKGIPEDKIPHIFERFYKADAFVKGVGLGLSICHTIMKYLHGSITCTSEENKGSCFTVRLPV